MVAGTALAGATLLHGWLSAVLVLAGVALLGAGVSVMTLPAPDRGQRIDR